MYWRKILAIIVAELMLVGQIIGPLSGISFADTNETFSQTDWSGGSSGSSIQHPTNKTGWDKYQSKQDYADTSSPGKAMMSGETLPLTDTTDTNFQQGTRDKINIVGTGSGASLVLDDTLTDPFVSNLKQWTSLPEAPALQDWSAYVKAGSYIYALWDKNVFGRYSIADDNWEFLAGIPGPHGFGASLVYPGTGDFIYATRGGGSKEFYKYSINGNAWTKLKDLDYNVGYGGSLAIKGDQIFCVVGSVTRKFCVYSITDNLWASLADITTTDVALRSSLVYHPNSSDYLYLGHGQDRTSFSRYRISTNTWASITPAAPICIADLCYPGTEDYLYAWYANGNTSKGFARFSLTSQTWEYLGALPIYPYRGILFYPGAGVKLKYLSAGNYIHPLNFDTSSLKWDEPVGLPAYGSHGYGLCSDGGDYIYTPRGDNGTEFYRYSRSENKWVGRASAPWRVYYGSSMVYSDGYVYCTRGYADVGFARYNPSTNLWETRTNTPATIGYGGSLAVAGSYIYAFRGANTVSFYRYHSAPNTWDDAVVEDAPATVDSGGALCYPGTGDFIYASRGNNTQTFWKYSIPANTWTPVADAPFRFLYKANLVYPGTGDYIYAFGGRDYNFARYNFSTDAWELLDPTPYWQYYYNGATVVGNTIYHTYGYSTTEMSMYTYDITTGKWSNRWVNTFSPAYGNIVYPGGDNVYMFYGNNSYLIPKYSLAEKKWIGFIKAPFELGYGTKACYPGSGNFIYVIEGRTSKHLWRYDYVNDTWAQKADAPLAFFGGSQLDGSGDLLFACQGRDIASASTEHRSYKFLKYTISTDTWDLLADMPDYIRDSYERGNRLVYVASANKVYWGSYEDAYMRIYDVSLNTWPSSTSSRSPTTYMRNGGSIYYPGSGDFIYCFTGENYYRFFKYSISGDAWTELSLPPFCRGYGGNDGDMFYPGSGDFIYLCDGNYGYFARYSLSKNDWDLPVGPYSNYFVEYYSCFSGGADGDTLYSGGYDTFGRYNISARAWTGLRSPYNDIGWRWDEWQPSLVCPGIGSDYLYTTRGRSRIDFACYSISENKWYAKASPASTFDSGHQLVATPSRIYALKGGATTTFWAYDPSFNQWSVKTPITGAVNFGSSMAYDGDSSIYATRGNNTANFYRYDIGSNSWTSLLDVPVLLGSASSYGGTNLVYPGRGDYIYLIQGSDYDYYRNSASFFRYSISQNTWEDMGSAPVGFRSLGRLVYPGKGDYLYGLRGRYYYDIFKYLLFKQGEYTSEIKNVGWNKNYNTVDWIGTSDGYYEFKARTADNASLSGATAWDNTPLRKDGQDLSLSVPTVKANDRYLQYKINLFCDDLTKIPQIDALTINYDKLRHDQQILSSPYDSTFDNNRLMKLLWQETLLSGTDVRLQLRTAATQNELAEASWLGPAGTQTFNNNYSTEGDYAYAPEIEVIDSLARLKKILQDYSYTQRVVLDNSAGSLSYANAAMILEITSSNNDFWGHVKSDGSDVRFADESGNTLSYNLSANGASFDYANKYAKIFVSIPSLPIGQKLTIYMKYGNADAVSASNGSIVPIPAGDACVGFWTFNEGSGATTADMSGRGNTGTLVNAPEWVEGRYGTALYFNGSSKYVNVGNAASLKFGLPFTYSMWIKLPGNIDGAWRHPVSNTSWRGSPGRDAMINSNQQFIMTVNGSECTSPRNNWSITTNVWHNIVYTVSSTTSKLYIDGVLKQTFSGSWSLSPSSYDTWIGNSPAGGYSPFWGTMDDVAIWNRDLTQAEVTQLVNMSYAGAGAVPYYFYSVEDNATSPSLSGWNYRSGINIGNSQGADLSNYQLKVQLTKDYEGFWLRCKNDGTDVRFVDTDNTTVLNYYRESFDYNNKTATFWVKVPSIPASSTKKIYLYYGRADAADVSNFSNVFIKDFADKAVNNTSALSLDGINGKATVNTSGSLNITSNLTLEANVKYAPDFWPSGWANRQQVTMDNSGGTAQTNAVTQFTVTYQAGMNTDFSDLRFWETDHSRQLRYRIVSSVPSTSAVVYVEIPSLPKASKDIYMYYGNAGATSESDVSIISSAPSVGLTGWWKMNDNAASTTVVDSSSGAKNGALNVNTNTKTTAGRPGSLYSALSFNGSPDRVTVSNYSLDHSQPFSVSFWMKYSSGGQSYGNPIYFVGGNAVRLERNGTASNFYWVIGGGSPNIGTVSYDTWHMVTLTSNGSTYKIYLDGNYLSSYSDTDNVSSASLEFGSASTWSRGIVGAMQDILIYNRELNNTEITQIYNGNVAIVFAPNFSAAQTEPATIKWLPGFGYRTKMTYDNSSGVEQLNSPLRFYVTYIADKMNADFSDLRFVDTNGASLKYRIEDYTASTQATVLVQMLVMPANSKKDFYMYYGNANAASMSDATYAPTAILKFDSDGNNVIDSSFTSAAYTAIVDPYQVDMRSNTYGSWTASYINRTAPITRYNNLAFQWQAYQQSSNGVTAVMMGWKDNSGTMSYTAMPYAIYLNGTDVRVYEGGADRGSKGSFAIGTWYDFKIVLKASSGATYYYKDVGSGTWVQLYDSDYSSETALRPHFTKLGYYNYSDYRTLTKNWYMTPGILSVTLAAEETQPAIDQTVISKGTAYAIKFTQSGLAGLVNGVERVSTPCYNAGAFMHTALTYDGANAKLYVDGVQKASTALTGAINTNGNSLVIGDKIRGAVDEARVWNIAVKPGNIFANKEKYLEGNEAGLACYLRFNENTGTQAADATANGNNAALGSGAGWLAARPFAYSNGETDLLLHMDEGAGSTVVDASGKNNNLTLNNCSWSITDLTGFSAGKSVSFNGATSYGTAADSASLDITGQISIEAWIRPNVSTGTRLILVKGLNSSLRWNYKLMQSFDNVAFSCYNGSEKLHMPASGFIAAGNTYHIVATFDESTDTVKIYGNGVEKYSGTETSAMLTNDDALRVGLEDSSEYPFSGLIDEVRIYNRILTPVEVKARYEHKVLTPVEPTAYNVYEPSVIPAIGAYVITNPVVQPVLGVFYTNKNMVEFAEISNKPLGTEIKYQLSPDGYMWYWYDGNNWSVVGGGYSNANTASEVNSSLAAFQDKFVSADLYYRAYLHTEPAVFSTPSLDNIAITLATGETYYIDPTGATAINPLHSDGQNDRWYQYRAVLYSEGMNTPIIDDVSLEYIKAFVTVTAPNGGEDLSVGQGLDITWNSQAITGATGTVKIQYSIDGGSVYKSIADNAANTGTYPWTVPDDPSQNVLIKITSNDFPVVSDTSDSALRILSLRISSPNGGEIWEKGKVHQITWSAPGAIPNNILKLEYSANNGSTWNTITTSAPNIGTYNWTLPQVESDTVKVRASSPTKPDIMDVVDAVFSIVPSPVITISSPTTGQSWFYGTEHAISWSTNSLVFGDQVTLQYSIDDFTTPVDIDTVSIGTPQGQNHNDDILGTYNWDVPAAISANVKVRIKEVSAPQGRDTQSVAQATSPAFSIIEPTITATSPVSENIWVVGDTHNITWTCEGSVSDDLLFEYSTDGFNFTQIATNEANDGTYSWLIPSGAAGDNVLIRISDNQRPQITGQSATIKILAYPTITITKPSAAEELTIGTNYSITWDSYGQKLEQGGADYNKINIYYSIDNGASWVDIAYHTANTGSYNWPVPDSETTQGLVKIVDDNSPDITFDISDTTFEIVQPVLTITSPNSSEIWYATGRYNITWTSWGSISNNLRLEYSTDGGSGWNTIVADSVPNTGSYAWAEIADVNTTQARIRISDVSRPAVTDSSDSDFSIIPPSISINAPTASEELVIGAGYEISWASTSRDYDAISDNLTLQYSVNDGAWVDIATGEYNDGSYTWTDNFPASPTSNCRIRIFDADRPATEAISGVFKIVLPYIQILSPNGDEQWPMGSKHDITWRTVGSVSNSLKIEYSTDNFAHSSEIITDIQNLGSYEWTVAEDRSDSVKIKITDLNQTEVFDASDAMFSIIYPIIKVTAPNGSELWTRGDTENITWDNTGSVGQSLNIVYSSNGTFDDAQTITADTVENNGTYAWDIPVDMPTTNTTRVRITEVGRGAVWDKSDADFTILPIPVITISAPTTGNIWRVGTVKEITWSDNGGKVSNNLTLEYSINGGSGWKSIHTPVSNTGSYNWTIPDDVSENCLLRITDASRPSTVGTSNSFVIASPKITITSPSGGEIWAAGDVAPITWTTEGTISGDGLIIEYSPDNGQNYYTIKSGAPNTGAYTWSTVPDNASGNNVFIRVKDAVNQNTVTCTSAVFIVRSTPRIIVTYPNGGEDEIFVLGDEMDITWRNEGLALLGYDVIIEFSNDNFINSNQTVSSGTPNTGTYHWVIDGESDTGRNCKIRITSRRNTEVTDMSDGFFRVRGGFTLTSPNGGENWTAKSPQLITWQTSGNIEKVKLEYTLDGGTNWTTIAGAANNPPPGINSYAWTLPDAQNTNAKVRISDSGDDSVNDVSNDKFNIVYCTVKFNVLDYDTLQHLADFNVNEPEPVAWSDSGLLSPITRTLIYPYGTYTTYFTKSNYIDNSVTWTTPKEGTSQYVVNAYMENSASAQVTWDAILNYSFSPATDTLNAVGSLQRKGKLVGTTELERQDMAGATVTIYEPDGLTIRNILSANEPNTTGMYTFTLANTRFESGKVYPATLSITYRERPYVSSANIDVGMEILQYDFFTKTSANLAASVSEIQSSISSSTTDTKKNLDATRTQLVSDIATSAADIKSNISSVLTTAENNIRGEVEVARQLTETSMKSEILNRETSIRTGQKLTVRYRTYTGLSPAPVIDVYDASNVQRVIKGVMAEIGTTGIYEYEVTFSQAWGKGDFTVVCSESTNGTLDALIISVVKTDLDQVSGAVSSIMGSTSGISSLSTVANSLNSQFGMIESALTKAGKDLVKEVKDAAGSTTAFDSVFNQLSSVSKMVKSMGGERGINLEQLYNVASEKKDDMVYLKNKTQELKAAMEINQKMMDNVANKPVTQTWYEYK